MKLNLESVQIWFLSQVKATLGLKTILVYVQDVFINFRFTHQHRCVLALYTLYFSELCEKNHMSAYYSGGFEPTTCSILEQCLTNETSLFKNVPNN